MPRKKLQKFAESARMKNILQLQNPKVKSELDDFLGKNQTIILELGCGRGEYTLALAEKFPRKKIIGIDIQGERLWHGAKIAGEKRLDNALFLRIQAEDLEKYFAQNTIEEIWLTFPDPYPKKSQSKKRLTSSRFLKIYQKILKPQGIIHLKTDNKNLFDYSQETILANDYQILEQISDLHLQKELSPELAIVTFYEKIHLAQGKQIHYLKFAASH